MALKPATPIEPYADLLPELDMVLIMTVEPGFGGQKFLDLCLPKIERTRALLDRVGGDVWLQVDGGVSVETIERCAAAGVGQLRGRVVGVRRRRPGRDGGRAARAGQRARPGLADRAAASGRWTRPVPRRCRCGRGALGLSFFGSELIRALTQLAGTELSTSTDLRNSVAGMAIRAPSAPSR